ncbi:MAG: hypothetical protein K8S23_02340 [Candidatus Cloacimonetes bacterium]|nr:hypothetical protein [Candidatus Cloacimonadota bacterium]
MKKIITFLFIIILASINLFSDSLEESLEDLSVNAAKSYVEPLVSAFGVNLNTGWFRRAPISKKYGIDLEFSFGATGTFFPKDKKDFYFSTSFGFSKSEAELLTEFLVGTDEESIRPYIIDKLTSLNWDVAIAGPTIIGSENDSIQIIFPQQDIVYDYVVGETVIIDTLSLEDDLILNLPVTGLLENLPTLPMISPQLGIGTVYGTKLVFRFLPTSTVSSEVGDLNFFGWGIQHNPKVWFDAKFPVDITFGMHFQTFKIGTIIESNATSFSINVSRTLGFKFLNITPYVGLMTEKSTMDFAYDLLIEDGEGNQTTSGIRFSMEGENKSRTFIGFALRLGIVDVNFDLNFGKYSAINLACGLGVEF